MDGLQEIKGLFEHRKGEVLIWDGLLPNGKKNQYWNKPKALIINQKIDHLRPTSFQ